MGDNMKDKQIAYMAKLLKSMSHPIRFKILCLLKKKEVSVGDLLDQIGTSRANISGHLNILRNQGVIDYRNNFLRFCTPQGGIVQNGRKLIS